MHGGERKKKAARIRDTGEGPGGFSWQALRAVVECSPPKITTDYRAPLMGSGPNWRLELASGSFWAPSPSAVTLRMSSLWGNRVEARPLSNED